VFLSLCGLVFVIGIAAAAASPSSSSSPPAASAPPAQTQAAVPPAPSKAAVATAKTVATFSGSGITNTAQFTVSSTWKLDYSFDCSNFGYAGNFIVMEDGGLSGAMNVNELAMSKTGSSYAYNDAGTHYIEVNSECSWTLKVIDEGERPSTDPSSLRSFAATDASPRLSPTPAPEPPAATVNGSVTRQRGDAARRKAVSG
jgi:hypothetical protein